MSKIDEPVRFVSYDPRWPTLFREELARLRGALPAEHLAIEHIGSTAVPGMPAKPTVDIMIGVVSLPSGAPMRQALLACGYEALGEAGVPGRLHFRLRDGGRSINVHVVEHGGNLWRWNLAFRDHLRSEAGARARYAAAKRRAIGEGANTLLAYSDAKAAVVSELMAEALARYDEGRNGRR